MKKSRRAQGEAAPPTAVKNNELQKSKSVLFLVPKKLELNAQLFSSVLQSTPDSWFLSEEEA